MEVMHALQNISMAELYSSVKETFAELILCVLL